MDGSLRPVRADPHSPRRISSPLTFVVLAAACMAAHGACGEAGWAPPAPRDTAPARIVLGWAGDPATSQAVTWRTGDPVASPQAQVGLAAPGCRGAADPVRTVAATPRPVGIGGGRSATHYKAEFTGLAPATLYAYRVGTPAASSQWHCFTTASAGSAPFRFIYLGDAQRGLEAKWPALVRRAFAAAPDARFVAHAGDLVDDGHDDRQWGAWVTGLGAKAAEVPGVPAPGNHDVIRSAVGRVFAAPDLWGAHFALPANGPADLPELAGQNYFIDYQGLRIVAIDVNAFANDDYRESQRSRVQAAELAWLKRVLGASPRRWTVVVQHQPMYSIAKGRDYALMRTTLGQVYDEYHVDLVLQGHDHAYGRTHKVRGGQLADPQAPGTVYVVSVSGTKMYPIATRWAPLMARLLEGERLYQVVSVTADRLSYESRTAGGVAVDAFELIRTSGTTSRYVNRAPGSIAAGSGR
jgi:3',5'-cyclic AMP phosphodiesterase CpdA